MATIRSWKSKRRYVVLPDSNRAATPVMCLAASASRAKCAHVGAPAAQRLDHGPGPGGTRGVGGARRAEVRVGQAAQPGRNVELSGEGHQSGIAAVSLRFAQVDRGRVRAVAEGR